MSEEEKVIAQAYCDGVNDFFDGVDLFGEDPTARLLPPEFIPPNNATSLLHPLLPLDCFSSNSFCHHPFFFHYQLICCSVGIDRCSGVLDPDWSQLLRLWAIRLSQSFFLPFLHFYFQIGFPPHILNHHFHQNILFVCN